MLRKYRLTAGLSISIVLFLVIGSLLMTPSRPVYKPYVSMSAEPNGLKGIVTLLKEQGRPVDSWQMSESQLPKAVNQMLIEVQPGPLNDLDRQSIHDWVSRGNHLLLLMKNPDMFKNVKTRNLPASSVSEKPKAENIEMLPGSGSDKVANGSQTLQGVVSSSYRLVHTAKGQILLRDGQGIIAQRIPVGKGDMTVFVTPDWLTNQSILKHSQFEMLWPQLKQPVSMTWFDDVHHGIMRSSGLTMLYPKWLILSGAQAALVLLLWLWLKGKRFGPVYTPRAWTVRTGDETLRAVSGWYQRKRMTAQAIQHQESDLRQRLHERWGLPVSAPVDRIHNAAAVRWQHARADALLQCLQDCEHMRSLKHGSVQHMIRISRTIDRMNEWLKQEG